MRKIMLQMTIFMGLIMSIVLSFVGTMMGGHFSIPSWLLSFAISFMISIIIGLLIPIKKIGDVACKKLKVVPESMKGNLVSGVVSDIIYTPVITIIMVCVMLKNAVKHMPPEAAGNVPTVGQVLPGSLLVCLIVGYIVIIIVQPILIKSLMKGMTK